MSVNVWYWLHCMSTLRFWLLENNIKYFCQEGCAEQSDRPLKLKHTKSKVHKRGSTSKIKSKVCEKSKYSVT